MGPPTDRRTAVKSRRKQGPVIRSAILGERIPGLLGVAAAIVKRIAVEVVGSGLGLRGNHGCDCLAEFSVVVCGGNLGFRDRVEGRVDDDLAEDWVLVSRAVQFVGDSRKI